MLHSFILNHFNLKCCVKLTVVLKDLFGDGFAIWYAKDRMEHGPVFGSKDLFSGIVEDYQLFCRSLYTSMYCYIAHF